jgi:hypothetical protein
MPDLVTEFDGNIANDYKKEVGELIEVSNLLILKLKFFALCQTEKTWVGSSNSFKAKLKLPFRTHLLP